MFSSSAPKAREYCFPDGNFEYPAEKFRELAALVLLIGRKDGAELQLWPGASGLTRLRSWRSIGV